MASRYRKLLKTRVCFLGYRAPEPNTEGLASLQSPLAKAYQGNKGYVKGIDAWLTIYVSGIQLQLVASGKRESGT